MLLYTDSVFEYQNQQGRFYGNEQFHRQLIDLNDRPISILVDLQFQALMDFGNGAKPRDDISLLGIEFNN
ncbi:MAG: SpoIIE family protein phosphatase [bacterium]|nr:SpoIIE family protein phosphatase [bacterium]